MENLLVLLSSDNEKGKATIANLPTNQDEGMRKQHQILLLKKSKMKTKLINCAVWWKEDESICFVYWVDIADR